MRMSALQQLKSKSEQSSRKYPGAFYVIRAAVWKLLKQIKRQAICWTNVPNEIRDFVVFYGILLTKYPGGYDECVVFYNIFQGGRI